MGRRPSLTTYRGAEIYAEILSLRRELYGDGDFFKMPEPWETLCEVGEGWSINTYRSDEVEDFRRKAGVIQFDNRVTLTVDEKLMANAKRGCKLSNFILAHEFGHVALNHHARSAVTKNFQLYAGPGGMSNLPPTMEELEANYAAVFFQCGAALQNPQLNPVELAHRAFSDVEYVRKAQGIVRLDVFQRELCRSKPRYERVIL
ncbi:MAG: hypothetical protein RID11_07385 [Roseovarius sp.]|jgi:hypothetical protein|uniref:hypothetical protein n=1 Tax=Roseovarius sp. TaxID=1486281 RepID=UPI0032EEC254